MAESNDSNELYPIAVLIDELKHSDAALRMKSMKNVQTIAIALGCERTRQELIPFLSEAIDDDDDVLLELAGQLAEIIPHVGGPDYAYTLLQPLEALVTVEEITVRTKSLEAVNVVGKNLSSEHFVEYFMPMLRRLVGVDWFTSRVSACGIFAVAYGKAPDSSTRSECIGIFGNLCRDDTPMVRRAAAKALGEIIKVADGDIIVEYLVPQFVKLAKDNQDSVKLLAMENGVALTQRLPENKSKELVLPIILELAADTSWRVRWSVGKGFGDMCEAMGESTVTSGFLDSFEKLLRDSEAEVRAVTAGNIGRAMAHIPSEVAISKIIPTVTTIVQDQSEHVRAGVAGSIMSMSETLGKDLSIEHLLPLFLQLLKDSNSDVRFNVISNLDAANKVIGVDLLAQSLLPAIVDLASDKQWRVRFAIIEYIPLLASQLGADFFNEKLVSAASDHPIPSHPSIHPSIHPFG